MDREYALENFERYIEISEDIEEAQMRDITRFINKIYDDFESRTCENCKYYDNLWCRTLDLGLPKSFGCNRWKENK